MNLNAIIANFQTFKLVDLLDIIIISDVYKRQPEERHSGVCSGAQRRRDHSER